MYIGRFVIAGRTAEGARYLAYRVSSRSFPNRTIAIRDDRAMVVPTADAAPTDNPYVSYNCLRRCPSAVVVANGSHVDPIIEKAAVGYPLRDAMALSLLALDYEHDQLNTPRVVAGWDLQHGAAYLGIVTADKVLVRQVEVAPGAAYLIATYELTDPTPIALQGSTPEALCDALFACEYDLPVAALAVIPRGEGWAVASRSVR
jgi:IMP cyclohydrolase